MRLGLKASARVIAAAALIMMSVFASFILDGDPGRQAVRRRAHERGRAGRRDGAAAGAGDAEHHGKWAWWMPRFLERIVPNVDIEGTGLHPAGGGQADVEGHEVQARPPASRCSGCDRLCAHRPDRAHGRATPGSSSPRAPSWRRSSCSASCPSSCGRRFSRAPSTRPSAWSSPATSSGPRRTFSAAARPTTPQPSTPRWQRCARAIRRRASTRPCSRRTRRRHSWWESPSRCSA